MKSNMKKILLIIMISGCGIFPRLIQHEHNWTIEVIYFDGSKDTLTKQLTVPYDSIPLELLSNRTHKGCLFIMVTNCDNLIECGVREYKIINYTFKAIEE